MMPMCGIFAGVCASAVRGARRPRAKVTMIPTMPSPMVVSSRWTLYALNQECTGEYNMLEGFGARVDRHSYQKRHRRDMRRIIAESHQQRGSDNAHCVNFYSSIRPCRVLPGVS